MRLFSLVGLSLPLICSTLAVDMEREIGQATAARLAELEAARKPVDLNVFNPKRVDAAIEEVSHEKSFYNQLAVAKQLVEKIATSAEGSVSYNNYKLKTATDELLSFYSTNSSTDFNVINGKSDYSVLGFNLSIKYWTSWCTNKKLITETIDKSMGSFIAALYSPPQEFHKIFEFDYKDTSYQLPNLKMISDRIIMIRLAPSCLSEAVKKYLEENNDIYTTEFFHSIHSMELHLHLRKKLECPDSVNKLYLSTRGHFSSYT